MPIYYYRYASEVYLTKGCSLTCTFDIIVKVMGVLLTLLTCGLVTNIMTISPIRPYTFYIMGAFYYNTNNLVTINSNKTLSTSFEPTDTYVSFTVGCRIHSYFFGFTTDNLKFGFNVTNAHDYDVTVLVGSKGLGGPYPGSCVNNSLGCYLYPMGISVQVRNDNTVPGTNYILLNIYPEGSQVFYTEISVLMLLVMNVLVAGICKVIYDYTRFQMLEYVIACDPKVRRVYRRLNEDPQLDGTNKYE